MKNKYILPVVVLLLACITVIYWWSFRQASNQGGNDSKAADTSHSKVANPYENNPDYALYEGSQYSFYYPTFFELDELVFDGSETSREFFSRESGGEIVDIVSFTNDAFKPQTPGGPFIDYDGLFVIYKNKDSYSLSDWVRVELDEDPSRFPAGDNIFIDEPYEVIASGAFKEGSMAYMVIGYQILHGKQIGVFLKHEAYSEIVFAKVSITSGSEHDRFSEPFIDLISAMSTTLVRSGGSLIIDDSMNHILEGYYESQIGF